MLPERFELSTSPLPRECSTPELRQRAWGAFTVPVFEGKGVSRKKPLGGGGARRARSGWTIGAVAGITGAMTGRPSDPAREARLKAALKANIARRKAQARARSEPGPENTVSVSEDATQAPSNKGQREDE